MWCAILILVSRSLNTRCAHLLCWKATSHVFFHLLLRLLSITAIFIHLNCFFGCCLSIRSNFRVSWSLLSIWPLFSFIRIKQVATNPFDNDTQFNLTDEKCISLIDWFGSCRFVIIHQFSSGNAVDANVCSIILILIFHQRQIKWRRRGFLNYARF